MLNLQNQPRYGCARKKPKIPINSQHLRHRISSVIPKLSIAALAGIMVFSIASMGNLANGDSASAAEVITATDGTATISFTIAGADKQEQVSAGRGETVYRTHTITLNASNIESYALTISGNPNMTNPSGSTTSDTITATNGSSNGTNLASNTWGYYYGEYNTTNGNNKESVVYKPLVSTGTTIDTGKPTNYTITNQTKNLVFAAKFGEDIAQGRYYANVNLAITATPAALTAKWSNGTNSGINYMQEMTVDVCNQVPKPTSTSQIYSLVLEDKRDGNKYIIKRLQDGNCWMTENLRLAGSKTLTTADSDVNSSYTLPASDVSKFTDDNTIQAMYYAGNTTYGAYYSWCAATAGSCTSATSAGTVASASVCPKGWKLPSNSGSKSFTNLTNLIGAADSTSGSSTLRSSSYNFVYAGRVVTGALGATGTEGQLWSNTAASGTNAYGLYFSDSRVIATDSGNRKGGRSIRCVMGQETRTLSDITTLQEVTVDVCNNTPIGNTRYTLKDSRDNNSYTVAKLVDGNCWMTQNLKLVGSRTLTANDSSVSANYTLPASSSSGFSSNTAANVYLSSTSAYGAYYTWCAVTAGTCSSATTSGQDAPSSICPKNWVLPPASGNGSYDNLMSAANLTNSAASSTILQAAPYNFQKAGYKAGSSISNAGANGYYWMRTARGSETAADIYFNNSEIFPVDDDARSRGFNVRCIIPTK